MRQFGTARIKTKKVDRASLLRNMNNPLHFRLAYWLERLVGGGLLLSRLGGGGSVGR